MSAFEMWWCDYHSANGPECEADVVNEDQARDDGWVRIERHVQQPSAIEGGRPWTRIEVNHVCPGCMKDPECVEWIEREGFAGYFTEDVEALAVAQAETGIGARS